MCFCDCVASYCDVIQLGSFLSFTHALSIVHSYDFCDYDCVTPCHIVRFCIHCCDCDTHTHTRLIALCPWLPGWSGTTKVKQSRFYWSKRRWVAVASAGSYTSLHLAPDRQPCQHTRPDALPATQRTASKHWRHSVTVTAKQMWFNCDVTAARNLRVHLSDRLHEVAASHNGIVWAWSTSSVYCDFFHVSVNKGNLLFTVAVMDWKWSWERKLSA